MAPPLDQALEDLKAVKWVLELKLENLQGAANTTERRGDLNASLAIAEAQLEAYLETHQQKPKSGGSGSKVQGAGSSMSAVGSSMSAVGSSMPAVGPSMPTPERKRTLSQYLGSAPDASAVPSKSQRTALPKKAASKTPSGTQANPPHQLLEALQINPEERRVSESLRVPLYKHQSLAFQWMRSMELDNRMKGGLLADDMGLGKTLTTIALIVSDRADHSVNLIVAPVGLMPQWENEIRDKLVRGRRLRVYTYYSTKKLTWTELQQYDVVITSYGTLSHQLTDMEKDIKKSAEKGEVASNRYLSNKYALLSPLSTFRRVILDEAQNAKNEKANRTEAVCNLSTEYRWCLTGTPMQNSVLELGPLVQFMQIRPYVQFKDYEKVFKCLDPRANRRKHYSIEEKQRAAKKLQVFVKEIMLRRDKKSMIDGKPILDLPKKTEVVDYAVFSADDQEYYNILCKESKAKINKLAREGMTITEISKALTIILRVRQACCHQFLAISDSKEEEEDDPIKRSIKLVDSIAKDVVRRLGMADVFRCSVCRSEQDQDPWIMCPCGHCICTTCIEEYQSIVDPAGINLGTAPECLACQETGPSLLRYSALKDVLVMREQVSDTNDDDSDGGKPREMKLPDQILDLRVKSVRGPEEHKRYLDAFRGIWQSSAKLDKCCEIISAIQESTGEKIIVFSSFTMLLDLLDIAITDNLKLGLCHYDGSMALHRRTKAVQKFTNDPEAKVMLASLTAGNAGLNLVAASHIIIMEPYWNPYVEMQAIDRAHRIGQVREVTVHRIIIEGTIERAIVNLQKKKQSVIEAVMSEKWTGQLAETNDESLIEYLKRRLI
ncbi:SNF2 family N-terminal domain-containing protein [Hypoxylon crocopeplum]|nr:SNF2 family N-terminal domain-containing protein [Hypoxylon crocopeplum]